MNEDLQLTPSISKIPSIPQIQKSEKIQVKSVLAPLLALSCVMLIGLVTSAESVPRFSAEQGLACVDCHYAPGGGAMRNEFGHYTMSVNELTLQSSKKKLLESYKGPRLSESVLIGVDARWRIAAERFVDTIATPAVDEYRVGSFSRQQADLYVSTEPFSHTYFNFTLSSGSIDESYFLLEKSDNSLWVQAGRFYPQFGLRVEDFSALVKQRTGVFHRLAVDGIAAGAQVASHKLALTYFTAGEQSVVLASLNRFGWLNPIGYFYGLSFRFSEEISAGNHGANSALKGAYAGLGWRGHSLIFEGDLIGESNDAYVVYIGASAKVIPGLYGKLDYNFYDPDRRLQSGAESFTRISTEFWPAPFVEVNPGVTFHTSGPRDGDKIYELRLHFAY